jgi:hypothetical protein
MATINGMLATAWRKPCSGKSLGQTRRPKLGSRNFFRSNISQSRGSGHKVFGRRQEAHGFATQAVEIPPVRRTITDYFGDRGNQAHEDDTPAANLYDWNSQSCSARTETKARKSR